MKTSEIQETLIKAAADLITDETPNYQFVAGRLINYHIRKEVYGEINPPHIYEHIKKCIDKGFYTEELLDWYTEDEWNQIDNMIDHSRDTDIAYAGMEQFRGKYLVKNRVTHEFCETPQMAYALIAATFFHAYENGTRMKWVKKCYDAISTFDLSLPTPIVTGKHDS